MKRRKFSIICVSLVAILLILTFTNPSESDYAGWLEKKHGITCVNTGQGINCYQIKANKKVEFGGKSRHLQNVLIYSIFEEEYEDMNGSVIKIRALGMLKQLFDY